MTGSQKSVWRNSVQHETKDFKIILEVLWAPASHHLFVEGVATWWKHNEDTVSVNWKT